MFSIFKNYLLEIFIGGITINKRQRKFLLGLGQFLGVTFWIPLALIFQKTILGETEDFNPNIEYAIIFALIGLAILVTVLLGIKDDD